MGEIPFLGGGSRDERRGAEFVCIGFLACRVGDCGDSCAEHGGKKDTKMAETCFFVFAIAKKD